METSLTSPVASFQGTSFLSQESNGCDLPTNVANPHRLTTVDNGDPPVDLNPIILADNQLTDTSNLMDSQPSISLDLEKAYVDAEEKEKASGAICLMLAPAGSVVADPPQTLFASNKPLEAFQQEPSGLLDHVSPVGTLSKRGTVIPPMQELSTNLKPTLTIYNLNNPKICLQSSDLNNLANFPDIQIPSSQELQKNHPLSTTVSPMHNNPTSEKLFSLKDTQPRELKAWTYDRTSLIEHARLGPSSPSNPYSIPARQNPIEESKKQTLYSKMLMPPNVTSATTGSAPECGVAVERINGVSLETYAWAVSEITGRSSISFIGRDPRDDDYILVFVKTPDMVEDLVRKGIWIRGRWLNISYFQQPAVRITVSNVLPFIPDSLIIQACEPIGTSVYPVLRKIPASVRSQVFKGAFSFRREIYLIKKSRDTTIPESISISFLGTPYVLELTNQGPKCFSCGSTLHTFRNCDFHPLQSENQDGACHVPVAGSANSSLMAGQSTIKDKMDNISNMKHQPQHSNLLQELPKPKSTRTFFTQCNVGGLPPLPNESKQINPEPKVFSTINKTDNTDKLSQSTNKVSILPFQKKQAVNLKPKDRLLMETSLDACMQTLRLGTVAEHITEGVVAKKPKKYNQSLTFSSPSSEPTLTMEIVENHEESLEQPPKPFGATCSPMSSVETKTLPPLIEEEHETPISTSISQLPARKTETPSRSTHKQPSKVEKDINESIKILDDWLSKSKKLKIFSRKKLTAQFLVSHPNMESVVKSALTRSDLYPNGSFRRKKAFELLEDIAQLSGPTKSLGHQKRKQKMVELR